MADAADILAFWYGEDPDTAREEWFEGGPAFDDLCRRFQPDWEDARAGGRAGWVDAPSSLLAFVILTDQIPRNLFRKDERAFATDARARAATRHALVHGWDQVMRPLERLFLYLPLEHSEDLRDQRDCVRLYEAMGVERYVEYARKHLELIERFGRFPHRNVMLGRTSTADEEAFLEAKGRGF